MRNAARHYRARVERLHELVAARFPAEIRITRPTAGFALWVELPGDVDATAIYRQGLERGIVIAPGELFAPASCSPGDRYRHCLRLNAASADDDRVRTAIEVLGTLVRAAP